MSPLKGGRALEGKPRLNRCSVLAIRVSKVGYVTRIKCGETVCHNETFYDPPARRVGPFYFPSGVWTSAAPGASARTIGIARSRHVRVRRAPSGYLCHRTSFVLSVQRIKSRLRRREHIRRHLFLLLVPEWTGGGRLQKIKTRTC